MLKDKALFLQSLQVVFLLLLVGLSAYGLLIPPARVIRVIYDPIMPLIELVINFNPVASEGVFVEQGTYGDPADPCLTQRFDIYSNQSERSVYLVALDLWLGLYRNSYADIAIEVYKTSPSGDIFITSIRQDRYSNPNGLHQRYISFAPLAFEIAPGETIFANGQNCYVAGDPSPLHPIIDLYFTH